MTCGSVTRQPGASNARNVGAGVAPLTASLNRVGSQGAIMVPVRRGPRRTQRTRRVQALSSGAEHTGTAPWQPPALRAVTGTGVSGKAS